MTKNGLVRETAIRYLLGLVGVAVAIQVTVSIFGNGRDAGGIDVTFTAIGALAALFTVSWVNGESGFDLRRSLPSAILRFLPVFLVMLAVVAVISYRWLPRMLWPDIAQETLLSLLGVQNWHQMQLASSAGPEFLPATPLTHMWAVSVAIQLIVVWALIGVAIRRWSRSGRISVLSSALITSVALTVVSVLIAFASTGYHQETAYYSTAARAWQFSLGAIAALLLLRRRRTPHRAVLDVLGWIGLLMIIATAAFSDGSHSAPGPWSLLPSTGVALIVLASSPKPKVDPVAEALGIGRKVRGASVGRVLDSLPGRHLGRHAWELWLWHWLVLAVHQATQSVFHVDAVEALHIVAITYVLAGASRFLVTSGMVYWRGFFPRVSVVTALAGFLVFIVAAAVVNPSLQRADDERLEILIAEAGEHPGLLAGLNAEQPWSLPPIPSPENASEDVYSADDWQCDPLTSGEPPESAAFLCQVTPEHRGGPRIAVTGGPDVLQWIAPLEDIASRYGWDLLVLPHDHCALVDDTIPSAARPECGRWSKNVMAALEIIEPVLVVTAGSFSMSDDGNVAPDPAEASHWQHIREHNFRVAVLATPSSHDPREPFNSDVYAAVPENTQIIDFAALICDGGICPDTIGNVTVYRGDDTVTNTFAHSATHVMESLFAERYPGLMRAHD